MPGPAAAAAISAGANLLGGLLGGGDGGEKAAKLQLAELRRQQRQRAREFAAGVGGLQDFAGESAALGGRFLGRGERGLRRTRAGLEGLLGGLDEDFDQALQARFDDFQFGLNQALPGAAAAGGRSGFSPFGGRAARAISGRVGQAQSQFGRDLIQSQLARNQLKRGLLGDIGGIDRTNLALGTGFRTEAGGLQRDIFSARLNTPGASDAIAGRLGESEEDLQDRTIRRGLGLLGINRVI